MTEPFGDVGKIFQRGFRVTHQAMMMEKRILLKKFGQTFLWHKSLMNKQPSDDSRLVFFWWKLDEACWLFL
jgi:hypothetical protein